MLTGACQNRPPMGTVHVQMTANGPVHILGHANVAGVMNHMHQQW